jgi:hypothetical protein
MDLEQKEAIRNQLKSFTRFIRECDVEGFLADNESESSLILNIASATKIYKEWINSILAWHSAMENLICQANPDLTLELVSKFIDEQFRV